MITPTMQARWGPAAPLMRFLGSVHLATVLLVGGALAMAWGTILEAREGRIEAQALVYRTLWFDAFLALIAINLIAAVLNRLPIQRHQWSFVVTHASLVLMLVGAWMSRTYGSEGQVSIAEGSEEATYDEDALELVASNREAGSVLQRIALWQNPVGWELPLPVDRAGSLEIAGWIRNGTLVDALGEGREADPPGIEVVLTTGSSQVHRFLLAGDAERGRSTVGSLRLQALRFTDAAALAARCAPRGERGALLTVVPRGGEPIAIPLPEGIGRVAEGPEGLQVRVLEHFSRARVESAGLVERESGPANPAAIVEVARGERREIHTVFGLYPDFGFAKGVEGEGLIEAVRLEEANPEEGATLSFLVGPAGGLFAQLTTGEGRAQAQPVAVGQSLTAPPATKVRIERFLPHARIEVEARALDAQDGRGRPLVRVEGPGTGPDLWFASGESRHLDTPDGHFELALRRRALPLPFSIRLEEFRMSYHPGSRRPATYESHVVLRPRDGRGAPLAAVISMNRPLDFGGFRLFQSGYRQRGPSMPDITILSVSHDPGVPVVYTAMALMILGVGWYFLKDARRKREVGPIDGIERSAADPGAASAKPLEREGGARRRPLARALPALLVCGALSAFAPGARASERPVANLPYERTASWAILADGRHQPLESHARESALAITGRLEYDDLTPLELYWGYHFDPEGFRERPYVRVDGQALKEELGLDPKQRRFSFQALVNNPRLQELVDRGFMLERSGDKLPELEKEALDAYLRIERAANIMSGADLSVVPLLHSDGSWTTPQELRDSEDESLRAIYRGFADLAAAYHADDADAFGRTADRLGEMLRAVNPQAYPESAALDRELLYNRLNAFGWAWKLYLLGFLTLLFTGFAKRRTGYRAGMLLLTIGLGLHTAGIALRWQIAGRAPVSDMYESLLFMGWGIIVIGMGLELYLRRSYFGLPAGWMGFLALMFAETLPLDSSINPLAPVLANTSWLAIHVMTIMLSYSAFALAMAMGHVVLGLQFFRPGKGELLSTLSTLLYKTLQVGLVFLAAGIAFGAIWANESWGRYWGWDPKETWSLITFFAYLSIVHARYAGWIHHFGLAVTSIAGFLSVIMTYYGVNFLLGAGLHSYGFSSGGTLWAGLYTAFEIGVILFAGLRYRRAVAEKGNTRAPARTLHPTTAPAHPAPADSK